MATRTIDALEDGAVARIAGVVRVADPDLLKSPLGHEECVYWDVRQGIGQRPERSEARDFWVEDDTGRVLVRADSVRVNAKADRREAVVERLEADIEVVSQRIKELKRSARGASRERQRELAHERRRLAKVATVLCAIRADVNGNVHVGGDAEGQRRWIADNRAVVDAEQGLSSKVVEVEAERWEVVLAPGERVSLEARFVTRPLPGNVAGAQGGYRERPTCLMVEPIEADGVVAIRGEEEAAPLPRPTPGAKTRGAPVASGPGRRPRGLFADPTLIATTVLVAVVTLLAYLLR